MHWLWATVWAVIGIVWARDVGSLMVCCGMAGIRVHWAMQEMDREEERG